MRLFFLLGNNNNGDIDYDIIILSDSECVGI